MIKYFQIKLFADTDLYFDRYGLLLFVSFHMLVCMKKFEGDTTHWFYRWDNGSFSCSSKGEYDRRARPENKTYGLIAVH